MQTARRSGLAALAAACMLVLAAPRVAATTPVIASADGSAPDASARLEGAALRSALQRGGYVVYFRHTATDFSRSDAGMRGYDDCANQRLLSDQGRRDAQAIGVQLKALRIPVAEAFASPYCRTMDHATRMLDGVTPRTELREAEAGDYPGLKQLLAAPVAAGGNRFLVGHGIPFRAVAGAPHLAEGEAAVLLPGTTRWTVVARLQVADWAALATAR